MARLYVQQALRAVIGKTRFQAEVPGQLAGFLSLFNQTWLEA